VSFPTRLTVAAALVGLLGTSCAGAGSFGGPPDTAPTANAVLNGLSASDVVAAIDSAGLPTPNAHDVTAVKCPKLGCVGAIDSDTVSILKFASAGPAQLYAGSISNIYQVEDLVLVFGSTVTQQQKAAYEQAVKRAVI